MKKLIYGIWALIIIAISGCGIDDISIIPQPKTHPVITSSHFVKNTETLTIDGSVDFNAPVDDLISLTAFVTNAQGIEVYREQPSLTLPGVRTGTVPFSVSYAAFPAGTYTLTIFLANSGLGSSNSVTFTFTK